MCSRRWWKRFAAARSARSPRLCSRSAASTGATCNGAKPDSARVPFSPLSKSSPCCPLHALTRTKRGRGCKDRLSPGRDIQPVSRRRSTTRVSRLGADPDQDAPATAPSKEVLQAIAPARQYQIFRASTREGPQRTSWPAWRINGKRREQSQTVTKANDVEARDSEPRRCPTTG